MAHLATCHSSGVIAQASGAAIAALQARAAAWEMPLIEQPDQIRLLIWGGELRLTPAASSMRIDLFAPEQRLIGVLRDSATEIFAEVGLTVDWQDLEVGALAPGLALMRVTDISRPSPSFLRVRLSGPEAARFAIGSLHFRLLLPQPGRAPVWPRVSASGRTLWPEGADALHRPVYTVRKQASDWLDFDIFRHPNSPTCDWAEADPLGQQVGILGPGGGGCPDAPRLRLFGDETALPAISRILHPRILARLPPIRASRAPTTCWPSCSTLGPRWMAARSGSRRTRPRRRPRGRSCWPMAGRKKRC